MNDANPRSAKIEILRAEGREAYPHISPNCMPIDKFRAAYHFVTTDTKVEGTETLAGRVTSIRTAGKTTFVDIAQEHVYAQLYLRKDVLGEAYDIALRTLDRGDWVAVTGNPCRTQRGELSLEAKTWHIMSKATRDIPFGRIDKVKGTAYQVVSDPELLRRWPELSYITDPVAYATIKTKSKVIKAIRSFYEEHDFMEMPIPIIEREYGGAEARPFLARVNALGGAKLPLRISHELTLKRLCVGGFPRVYHLGPAFRNEGIDADHHPEFLLTESYAFNQDYHDVMDFFEQLVHKVIVEATGSSTARFGPNTMEFKPPWKRISMSDSLKEYAGIDVNDCSLEKLQATAVRCNLDVLERYNISSNLSDTELVQSVFDHTMLPLGSRGKTIAYLFSEIVEPQLTRPTIVYDHPWETSPLCKRHRDPSLSDKLIERFEGFAGCGRSAKNVIVGSELCNAYTELNDPLDQRARMEEQARQRIVGNEEAYPAPEEFLQSVEYGLPPLGGLGFGVDRLVMIATGYLYPPENPPRIQDVVLFPLMKPLEK